METCTKCRGFGVVDLKGVLFECECSLYRRLSSSMPSYIRKAKILSGHLNVMGGKNSAGKSVRFVDAISKSFLILSTWSDMKAIIKAVMIKHNNKHVRITSDREIRDVFVGAKSTTNSITEDSSRVFNTLSDLMEYPNLVIVRLNELLYKNKAAPGALEEALCIRVDRDKPTWVISDLDRPFGTTSYAYSDSVWDLITTGIDRIQIPRVSPRINKETAVQELSPEAINSYIEESKETKAAERAKPETKKPTIKSIPDNEDSSGLGMYGQGLKKSKSKFNT